MPEYKVHKKGCILDKGGRVVTAGSVVDGDRFSRKALNSYLASKSLVPLDHKIDLDEPNVEVPVLNTEIDFTEQKDGGKIQASEKDAVEELSQKTEEKNIDAQGPTEPFAYDRGYLESQDLSRENLLELVRSECKGAGEDFDESDYEDFSESDLIDELSRNFDDEGEEE